MSVFLEKFHTFGMPVYPFDIHMCSTGMSGSDQACRIHFMADTYQIWSDFSSGLISNTPYNY